MNSLPESSNGEWRKRLDRIEAGLEHLLQLGATHDNRIGDLRRIAGRTLSAVETLAGVCQNPAQRSKDHDEEISRLNRKMAEAFEAARLAAETGKHTDQRLNALIGFVAGGKSHPPPPNE